MKASKQVKVIEGLITASDWDDNGEPTEVKICSSGEIDYLVEKSSKGDRLLAKVREFVKVEGAVTESGSTKSIKIKAILSKNG
jgi:hypothetical protein